MSVDPAVNASISPPLLHPDATGTARAHPGAAPAPLVRPESLRGILHETHAPGFFDGPTHSPPALARPPSAIEQRYEVVAERRDFDPRGSAGPADLTLYRDTEDRSGTTYRLHIEARWLVDLKPRAGDNAWTVQAGYQYIHQSLPQSVDRLFDGLVLHLDNGTTVELDVDIDTKLQELTGSWLDRWLADRVDSFAEQEWLDLVNGRRPADGGAPQTLYRSDMPEPTLGGLPAGADFPGAARGLADFVAAELLGLRDAGYTDLVRYADAVEVQQREENRLKPVPEMPPALAEELAPFLDWIERKRGD